MKTNVFNLCNHRKECRNTFRRVSVVLLLAVLSLFVGTFSLSAQSAVQLQGTVKDSVSTPLSDCSVLLYAVGDTLPLLGVSTDRAGHYAMSVDTGTYRMQVSHVGYETFVRDLRLDKSGTKAVDVVLTLSSRQLTEVVITEEEGNSVAVDRDKLVYKIPSRVKRSALDSYMALTSIPSLRVNPSAHSIELVGAGSTVVMVNGVRRDHNYLQMIRPEQIDRVEITRYPSMRYTLQGIDAIVNIVTKEPAKGYSTYALLQQDPSLQYGYQGVGLVKVADKWTLSLNVFNFYFDEKGGHSTLRRDKLVGDEQVYRERRTVKRTPYTSDNTNLNFSADYKHSDRSFSVLSLVYAHEPKSTTSVYGITERFEDATKDREFRATQKDKKRYQRANANFYHQTKWAGKHTFSVNADYALVNNNNRSGYYEMEENENPFFVLDQRYYSLNHTLETQFNMEHHWKKWTLEEGYRFKWVKDDLLDRKNGLQENVAYSEGDHDFYAGAWYDINSWFSLRGELAVDLASLRMGDRNYSFPSLNPTALIRYKKYNHVLSLRYAYYKIRPGLSLLTPIVTTVDSVRFYVGNSNLKATSTNSLKLSYEKTWEKQTNLYLALGYLWGRSFSQLVTADALGRYEITYANAAKRQNVYLDFSFSRRFFPGWRLGIDGGVKYVDFSDPSQPQFNKGLWNSSLSLSSEISYKKFFAYVHFPISYRQNTLTGYYFSQSQTWIDASYRLNNHWGLMLNLRYLIPIVYQSETTVNNLHEYYRETKGRAWRAIVGVRYSFWKGQQMQYKSRKRRNYNDAYEGGVQKF